MTFADFKRQLNENLKEVLEIMEESGYLHRLPANPELEDWYVLFFTVWNDNISDVVVDS